MIRFTSYGVIAEKPRVGKLGQLFSVHPVGKTMRCIKKWMTTFMMGTTSSITMQRLGKIAQCAPAVGAKMWCLCFCFVFVFFCWSRSESGAPCARGLRSSSKHCVAVYCPISTRFSVLFQKGLLFQILYLVRIPVARWLGDVTIFAKLRSKIAKSRKISGKVCAQQFV